MEKKEKVIVYIDGGNTYRRLKSIGLPKGSSRFDYSAFIDYLVGDRNLVSKTYYIGIVRNVDNTDVSEKMVRSQQKFLSGLKNEDFKIEAGRIMYDGGSIREKGVDVKLCVDMVVDAVDDKYDTAIIISSDTDLIPAIKYVRNSKYKKVEYIGFGETPSLGMIKESSTPRIFSQIDLIQFQYKTIKFKEYLVSPILEGKKVSTWRLFDDKKLEVNNLIHLQNSDSGKDFALAVITSIDEKTFDQIKLEEYDGIENFKNKDEMINHFKKFYGEGVNRNTIIKVVNFSLKK